MNCSTVAHKEIGVCSTSVSDYVPDLLEKFAVPEAELALVRYEGMLGARRIGEVVLLTRKGKYVAFDLPSEVLRELTVLCESLLEARFPEWSQGEGAEGRFEWDLKSDCLDQTHKLRVLLDNVALEGIAPIEPSDLRDAEIPF